ncbi:MAG: Nramp family divalent metal transporter [Thermaerobacter sp.]|nr:Nramp family divalent metal transporter [Thermaerobacter sp.]
MDAAPELAASDLHQTRFSLSARTEHAARQALLGRHRGLRALWPFLGPAFIAAVAYVDPGNFATNIQGGAEFGYNLLWVVVLANLMAMVIQSLSAKLGIACGQNLPELCARYYSRPVVLIMWVISEFAAMATDLAEFLGATLGLNLLLHIPLLVATVITGIATYLILSLDKKGFRPLEWLIAGLVMVIALSYGVETVLSRPNWGQVAYHAVVPWVGNSASVLLIVGIVGATVMPHVVYLHSGLTQSRILPRNQAERLQIYRFERIDVALAMTLAGLINLAMLFMAASVFHFTGHQAVANITTAYRTLTPILGAAAAGVFLISLLASGISSSAVGTMAGQVIMQGFVGFSIPVGIRRLITMLPTVVIVALGVNPTETLIVSQVVLSLVLPVPIVALVRFTGRQDIMGALVNRPLVQAAAWLVVAVIVGLNATLLLQMAGITLPGLGA